VLDRSRTPASTAAPDLALEVVARFGDSVVDVTHLAAPVGWRRARRIAAIVAIGLGVACLAVTIDRFATALNLDTTDRQAYAEWILSDKPAYAFRARVPDPVDDALVAGAAVLGAALLALGLPALSRARRGHRYRVGTAPGVDHACCGVPAASFPLVASEASGFVIHVMPGMDGGVSDAGGRRTLADAMNDAETVPELPGARALVVAPGMRAHIRFGLTMISVATVDAARRPPRTLFAAGSGRFAGYLGGVLAAHLAVLALLETVPLAAPYRDDDGLGQGFIAPVGVINDLGTTASEGSAPGTDGGGADNAEAGVSVSAPSLSLAPQAAVTPATVSSAASKQASARSSTEPAGDRESQAETFDTAREAGILGSVDKMREAFAQAPGVTEALRNGFDQQAARGGVIDANSADGGGTFASARLPLGPDGWGSAGPGFGVCGCGTGWGTIGTGRYGTIGHGKGAGDGYGIAGGSGGVGGLHARQTVAPHVGLGAANAFGDRDKGIIRRYIKRHLAEFQYCYDRERMQRHDIAGELNLEFVISASGRVQSSHAEGFDDRVGACVADVAAHIEFPAVKSAGPTEVYYPLRFEPY
jgi:hypothetical protein